MDNGVCGCRWMAELGVGAVVDVERPAEGGGNPVVSWANAGAPVPCPCFASFFSSFCSFEVFVLQS